jgi:hypothetical protein
MKTSELTGAALDWAVALIEHPEWKEQGFLEVFPHDLSFEDGASHITYTPSTDWSQGGPIIEREGISICNLEANSSGVEGWTASMGELWSPQDDGLVSATPLIAAMRAFVASKLGDEVEIPEELMGERL